MTKIKSLLNARLTGDKSSKMAELAKQSADGNLNSFAGLFSLGALTEEEKSVLANILQTYAAENDTIPKDLESLSAITAEVKAINNQATLLHGERIKKAQSLLTRYRDGAFTAWLVAAYGNRQTPYNFLQYYEFCSALPKNLRSRIDHMPRQVIYTLASRDVPLIEKQKIISDYNGETKSELLQLIRERFPISVQDRRQSDAGTQAIKELTRLHAHLSKASLTHSQKKSISNLLDALYKLL